MMLHSVKELKGYVLSAQDGDLGKIRDVYFDDEKWTIRHLVADTGGWLALRKVLVSPFSVMEIDWRAELARVNLTRQQVENSPSIDEDKPVSRQFETELYDYYGYPYYWAGPSLWGYTAAPEIAAQQMREAAHTPIASEIREQERERADPHLRSAVEVIGYHIQTSDDSIGHVEDFLFTETDWSIRMMVVDTRNWWPGKHVLISPRRITDVDWAEQKVVVNASREQVERSPEYDPQNPPALNATDELYRHAGRPPVRQ